MALYAKLAHAFARLRDSWYNGVPARVRPIFILIARAFTRLCMRQTPAHSLLPLALLPLAACGKRRYPTTAPHLPRRSQRHHRGKRQCRQQVGANADGQIGTNLPRPKPESAKRAQHADCRNLYGEVVVSGNQVVYVDGSANYAGGRPD